MNLWDYTALIVHFQWKSGMNDDSFLAMIQTKLA